MRSEFRTEIRNLKPEFRNQKSQIAIPENLKSTIEKSEIKSLISENPVLIITVYPSLRCPYFKYRIGKIVHISPLGVGREILMLLRIPVSFF